MTQDPGEGIQSIDDLDVAGRRVLVRVDFNVPLSEDTQDRSVADDTRIRRALPTLNRLLERGARLIVASHLGRPKGQAVPELSLLPVAAQLAKLLNTGEVVLTDDCIGDGARKVVGDLRDGQVALLENLRFHPEEKANDENFARELAKFGDVYVNDAFGVAHRRHASVDALPRLMRERAAGNLMTSELSALSRIRTKPEAPYVAVLGGAKVTDKIAVIEALLQRVNALIIGGAMANTFLAAQGHGVGQSLYEPEKLALARSLLLRAEASHVRILLPTDVSVGPSVKSTKARVLPVSDIGRDDLALDVGPESLASFASELHLASTIFWNGPMGLFENPAFSSGTVGIAKAIADAPGFTVVGGGDSVRAITEAKLTDRYSHVSTGGGASLAYLEGKALPGVNALRMNPDEVP